MGGSCRSTETQRGKAATNEVVDQPSRFITRKLKLRVNEKKSAVGRPHERKFLGFSFTREEKPRRTIAPKSIQRAKNRLRELTRRKRGSKRELIVKELKPVPDGMARQRNTHGAPTP